ncbi:MAG: M48 family metalloprotease [bacterium]|nr:M48 family metalloprotease [bacterium]
MSLYTQKDSNIRKTWFLMSLFLVVVIGLGWVFGRLYQNPAIVVFAVLFSLFMNFLSYWYSDKIVLRISKAEEIKKENAPEIYNIVENLSITAGLQMPKIYLMNDSAINAFATGRDPKHAVVAVTRGALEKLDRSELEGVIAHEMSHIGNRDILLSTVIVVLVGFVALLADFFLRTSLWGGFGGRGRDREGSGGIMIVVGIALAVLAPLAATLIQLSISRKREFLADASGSLLTRYPEGLARALEKISKDATPLKVANRATSHLWIASPSKAKIASWFMTHPPIEERIKRLREMSV